MDAKLKEILAAVDEAEASLPEARDASSRRNL
jgi:hypothetical protein